MKHSPRACLFTSLLCFVSSSSLAEPSRITQWLMSEPMSQLDWGIYKSQRKLDQIKDWGSSLTGNFFFADARYEWDTNRIILVVNIVGTASEKTCMENIKMVKGIFLGGNWNEKEQFSVAPAVLRALFSHEGGYQSNGEPKDLGESLATLTYLQVHLYEKTQSGSLSPKLFCQTGFRTAEISFTRK